MIDDAAAAGCECVKFQCHIVEDGMLPGGSATDRMIWEILSRCSFNEYEERRLKTYVESKGLLFLSTPFSRASADRLHSMDVAAYKIGSGECNNYPLVRHVAAFGKPVIVSTGMNDIASIRPTADILQAAGVPTALLHCTSLYPTPHQSVRLGALQQLAESFPEAAIGISDHSSGNYACFGAVALGARIVEKHFTSDKTWPGPDMAVSIDPKDLADLVRGCRAVFDSLGGSKSVLREEHAVIQFAYASVVATQSIQPGEVLTATNIWVKRPGTGEIRAADYDSLLGRRSSRTIERDTQIRWSDLM